MGYLRRIMAGMGGLALRIVILFIELKSKFLKEFASELLNTNNLRHFQIDGKLLRA